MATPYDAIIIGTGQAGPHLAQRLTTAGMRVAIIERKLFGGTCVNTGCIPTKAMVASAYVARMAARAAEFGVETNGPIQIDMKRVKARKDAISEEARESLESWLRRLPGCTVYQDYARFESSGIVRVGSEQLAADRIFINVGGRASVSSIEGVEHTPYLTDSSMMDLDVIPQHLVIVGGSYVGLEFGQMFRRFGSEVTIIEMSDRLIHREDEDVSQAVRDILEREGITVRLNAKCIRVEKRGDEIVARADCASGEPEICGTHVLLAVGRRPNTDDLGIEEAGLTLDSHGYITVDDQLRTNVPGIWALGDCNGKGAFTHTSFNDSEIVAANLLDNDARRVSDRIRAYALYIDPPLGRAGMTEAEVRKDGRLALIGKREMAKIKRAVEKGETQGFLKILVDAQDRQILGAAVLGTGGDEVIHAILDIMSAKAPYTVLQRTMHIHPTVSEYLPTVLGDLQPLVNPV